MDEHQQLVDRLVVVTEEQDVLWFLVMIGEMKESGCLQEAINASHSWKRYSALQAISRLSDLSTLHRFIAQLLVLSGATTIDQGSNEELLRMMGRWEEESREEAREAQNLLSLDIADAADWIDSTLPLPPNPDSLTGGGPLPPRPTYLSPTIRSIPNTPETSPLLAHVESFDQPSLPASEPCPRLFTILVSGLPGDFATAKLGALFSRTGVETHHLWFGTRGSAFAQVAAENVQLCIDSLDRSTILGDLRISCGLAKNQLEDSTLPRSRSSSPSRRHRPSSPSLVSISNEPSSFTCNKPTLTHSSGRAVSTCLDSRDDRPRIRRQTLSPSNRSLSPRRRPRSRSPGRWEDEDVRRRPSQLSTRDRDSHSPRRPSGWTTLHVAGLRPHFDAVSIARVFKNIGVATRSIHRRQKNENHFAFVDVESSQVAHCVGSLNNKQLEGRRVNCHVSKPRILRSSGSFDSCGPPDSPPRSPSTQTTSELHLAHLPLHFTHLQVRELFHDLGVSPLAIRQRNNREGTESFAFVEVDSEDVPRCIYRLDFELISNGVRLSCQLAREPRQHHHRTSSSASVPLIDRRPRDRQSFTNSRDEEKYSSNRLTYLHVAGLHHQTDEVEVVQLFARFGIKLSGLRLLNTGSSNQSSYAFVEVGTEQVEKCLREIDRSRYKGYSITCRVSRTPQFHPLPTPPPLP